LGATTSGVCALAGAGAEDSERFVTAQYADMRAAAAAAANEGCNCNKQARSPPPSPTPSAGAAMRFAPRPRDRQSALGAARACIIGVTRSILPRIQDRQLSQVFLILFRHFFLFLILSVSCSRQGNLGHLRLDTVSSMHRFQLCFHSVSFLVSSCAVVGFSVFVSPSCVPSPRSPSPPQSPLPSLTPSQLPCLPRRGSRTPRVSRGRGGKQPASTFQQALDAAGASRRSESPCSPTRSKGA
jgi:hypothetical protein